MKRFTLLFYLFCLILPLYTFAAQETTPVVSDSWLNEAIENIQKEEYRPSVQKYNYRGDKFTSPKHHFANRANNLRAYFDEKGMELIPRAISEKENWNLKIKSIEFTGANKEIKTLKNPEVMIDGNNIKCERNGIKIIYSNSENGIQQNLTIREKKQTGMIDFDIEAKNLEITMENDRFILNGNGSEIVLRVEKIEDAGGKELEYFLCGDENKLSISLNTEDPAFPIKIITNITSRGSFRRELSPEVGVTGKSLNDTPDWSVEANQDSAQLGYSVSTAGDVNGDGYSDVIVGAFYYDNGQTDEGRAFVYHGSSSGLSTSFDWSGESNQAGALFGNSVSTAGDVNGDGYSDVIVGAYGYDNGQNGEGRAYVYHGSSSGLSTSADWLVESNQESAVLGWSVSTAGDVNGDGYSDVIVGAHGYDNGQTNEGRAFAYHGSSSGLSSSADWWVESNQEYSFFGVSVSTAGDVNGDGYSDVIVGAGYYDNGETNEGRAYVYHGSSSGLSSSADWWAESNQESAAFGWSVSNAGDVNGDGYSDVIVGAVWYDNGETNEGRAYVYHGSSSGLSSSADWWDESNQLTANFGISVSTAGDVNGDGYSDVIVGAHQYDNGQTDEGAAFVYLGSSSGLSSSFDWSAEADQVTANFGVSVSTAGDVNGDGYSDVIVGARYYDNGQTDEGTAFVYHGNDSGLSISSNWTAESNQVDAHFGFSVSTAGDVNGDGYSDVIVGAKFYDNGQTDEGAAFVYLGSSSGLSPSFDWSGESNQAEAWYGYSVSTAGDVNGDGYSDVIVGAHHYDNGQTNEGRAYLYHGSSSGLSSSADWWADGEHDYAYYGKSVSTAGDVNGDGYSDVIVGAYGFFNGQIYGGAAFVYHGSSSGLPPLSDWWSASSQQGSYFGYSVSTAGDVNGDGYSDVIVGAYLYDNGETDEGMAFVYHGSPSGLYSYYAWGAESNKEESYFGVSVSTAGDVNGDGYSDVIVGAHGYDNGETDEGAAFVYHGSSSGLSSVHEWGDDSDQAEASYGYSVSTAGDVNGDGYSDVIVGAKYYDNGQINEGRAYLYHGSSSGLSTPADWNAESNQQSAYFGYSVSTAGDVNGDGYSDVIVGAFGYNNGQAYEGRACVYYGNLYGISLIPTQFTVNGSHPVQLGNATESEGVQLNILGRTPGGRGKVKLQWEIKEFGQSFNGTSLSESSVWYDTGTNGIEISEDVTGLNDSTAYHWRARLKYSPQTYNGSAYSRWLSVGPNGWNEKDFITTSMSGIGNFVENEERVKLGVYPSISTGNFSISFYLSEKEAKKTISLRVYNKVGMVVKELFKGKKSSGIHTINWMGINNLSKSLPDDIYFISLKKGTGEHLVRKVVLLR